MGLCPRRRGSRGRPGRETETCPVSTTPPQRRRGPRPPSAAVEPLHESNMTLCWSGRGAGASGRRPGAHLPLSVMCTPSHKSAQGLSLHAHTPSMTYISYVIDAPGHLLGQAAWAHRPQAWAMRCTRAHSRSPSPATAGPTVAARHGCMRQHGVSSGSVANPKPEKVRFRVEIKEWAMRLGLSHHFPKILSRTTDGVLPRASPSGPTPCCLHPQLQARTLAAGCGATGVSIDGGAPRNYVCSGEINMTVCAGWVGFGSSARHPTNTLGKSTRRNGVSGASWRLDRL
jgi:hypothetical protein